jgi:hypothetical protein
MISKRFAPGLAAAAAIAGCAGEAAAQVTPGDFARLTGLSGLFRTEVTISNPAPGGPVLEAQDRYSTSTADAAFEFLSDEDLRRRFPTYNGVEAVEGVLDFRGVLGRGSYAAGSTTLVVEIPALGERLTFTGATRAASYEEFELFLEDLDDADAEDLVRRFLAALARFSPVDPIAGNPYSLQGTLIRDALDLSADVSALEASIAGAQAADEPAWMVGVSVGQADAGRFASERLDARVQRTFRVMEGGRSRLKLEAPLSFTQTEGAVQVVGGLAAALEMPLIDRRWSVEPRVAYGAVVAPDLGSVGHMMSATVTSRLVFEQVGRGHIVIGNMVGYTTTLPVGFFDDEESGLAAVDPELGNGVFRNGVAYQFPLRGQFLGRQPSVRASVTHTAFTGDPLFLDSYTDVGLSLGVRGREGTPRNAFELLRLSANFVFGEDYEAFNLTLGYRF